MSIRRPSSFIDTFNNNRLDGWTRLDEGNKSGPSNWRARKGRLRESSNIHGGSSRRSAIAKPGTILRAGNRLWENYDYTVELSSSDNDAIGVVFRFQDRNNYYRFSMDKERRYRRLVKKVDGKYRLLAQNNRGYVSGRTYRIRVLAVGQRIQVFLNGMRIFDVTDSRLSQGRVGLYAWGSSSTTFDDVSVKAQTDSYFTIAAVPDTQYASARYPGMLASQMRWLARNRARLNLSMVLQEGDIVNVMSSPEQWSTARKYYGYLDGKVPFLAAAGNHDDQDLRNDTSPYTKDPDPYNDFIRSFADYTVDRTYAEGDYRNSYRLFTSGGVDMMVLTLEFGAPDDVLAWAGEVVAAHPARHVLMLTHDYLGSDNQWRGSSNTDDPTLPHNNNPTLNDGIVMWQEFVSKQPNVQFTFNGHDIRPVSTEEPWAVGRLVSHNDAGLPVYQMLANYQKYDPAGRGYLRLLRIYPLEKRVEVSTYSPYENRYLGDSRNRFSFSNVDLDPWTP